MKHFLLLSLLGFLAVGCAPGSDGVKNDPSQLVITYDHTASGTYNATISQGGSSATLTDGYVLDYSESGGNTITGRHNFQGIQSGYKRVSGTKNGNTFTYTSTECSGDTFSGTFDLTNGAGTFSGTVCGYTFSGGMLGGMAQTK